MSTNTASLANYHPKTPQRKPEDYADIIDRERPTASHSMSIEARAAQFAPYAALVGHQDIISANEQLASTKTDPDGDVNITTELDPEFLPSA